MDVIAFTRELIGFHTSAMGETEGISRWLEAHLTQLGMEAEVITHSESPPLRSVIGIRPSEDGRREGGLLLAGHMDTVPVAPGRRAGLEAKLERGRLFGRGAADMKGGIGAILEAVSRFVSVPLRSPLTVAFTDKEEDGMDGAKALAASGRLKSRTALVAEPTGLIPIRMHKGYLTSTILLSGRSCHSSRPDLGQNALTAGVAALSVLEALGATVRDMNVLEGAHFFPPYSTFNVGRFEAGTAANIVPGRCEFTLEIRNLPSQDQLMERAEAAVRTALRGSGVGVSVKGGHRIPPLNPASHSPLLEVLELLSGNPSQAVSYATEGPFYQGLGMDVVIFGPGSVEQAHKDDEFVLVGELHRAVDILAASIQRFCG